MQAGVFLMLFFAWNSSQTFEELEVKQSVIINRVLRRHTHFLLITGASALMIVHSVFSAMAGLVVEMLFTLFITLTA